MSTRTRACDYCGLPVPSSIWGGDTEQGSEKPAYCCFGCRFAHAVTQESGETGAARWTLTRLGIAIFFTMNAMVFTVALWAYGNGVPAEPGETAGLFAELFRFICLLASLPVLFLLGVPLAASALSELRRGRLSTDLLLMVGVVAAYAYSITSVWRGAGDIYFEVGCMVLVFVTMGRWLEATGKLKSTEALDGLSRLLPERVTRIEPTGEERTIPLSAVAVGDRLRVRAGERVPTDGILCSPRSTLDEQLITGESWPVEKVRGDTLTGGTLNLDGYIELEVTASPTDGTLARLVNAVRAAREQKGHHQQLADRIVSWFFPVVIILALATLLIHSAMSGLGAGLLAALSVVLIACPCALGIATPMAIWAAIGSAARRGIILQNGDTLERLAGVRAIAFDKTGTLTTGQPRIGSIVVAEETTREAVLLRANSLAATSSHPLSLSIVQLAKSEEIGREADESLRWEGIENVPGLGLIGRVLGEPQPTLLGNRRLFESEGLHLPTSLVAAVDRAMQAGVPIALVGWQGEVRALFMFDEELRSHAAETIEHLTQSKWHVELLTGDHHRRGARLASELNVAVRAELSPDDKLRAIAELRQRWGTVAMIGDGINDAAAIAAADVGIALGCGADVTRESADVCLISNELQQIPWLLELSQRTLATVRGNLAWAFGYNSVGILLAMCGWLHPSIAAMLMVGSSLIVITRSLRLASATPEPLTTACATQIPSRPVPQEAAT